MQALPLKSDLINLDGMWYATLKLKNTFLKIQKIKNKKIQHVKELKKCQKTMLQFKIHFTDSLYIKKSSSNKREVETNKSSLRVLNTASIKNYSHT